LILQHLSKQNIECNVRNFDGGYGDHDWLFEPSDIFSVGGAEFYVIMRAHISRLKGDNPRSIAKWIEKDAGLQVKMSNKDDIIAYGNGTSKEIIDQIFAICNHLMLPEEIEKEKKDRAAAKAKTEKEELDKFYLEDIALLTEEIRLNPQNSENYVLRSLSYIQRGVYNLAIDDINEALRLNPNNADAYDSRAKLACTHTKDYDQALTDSTKAILLAPNRETAYITRAGVYCGRKEFDKAVADFEKALQLAPNDKVTSHLLEHARRFKKEADEKRKKEKKKRFWSIFSVVLGGIIGGSFFASAAAMFFDTDLSVYGACVLASLMCGIVGFIIGCFDYMSRLKSGCGFGCCGLIAGIVIAVASGYLLEIMPFMAFIAIGVIIGALTGMLINKKFS